MVCTLVFNANANCVGAANLPGGTLAVRTLAPANNGPVHVAITGGTGRSPTGNNTSTDSYHLNFTSARGGPTG